MNEPSMAKTDAEEQRGLVCPKCSGQHFFVVYTRRVLGRKIMRCRECRHCGRRVITYEHLAF
jgi:transcriptional regulator NrdR family protein